MKRIFTSSASLALVTSLALSASSSDLDWPKIEAKAKIILTDLIQINTINPPGNEEEAARHIEALLSDEGIDSEVLVSTPGRANIVSRINGDGSQKPLLLLGHLDVVGVQKENWKFDPMAGKEGEGFIYGRGTLDDKGLVAANLAVFMALKQANISLKRDVIFLALADEESGGALGLKWMIANHWDKISAQYAINEGGFGLVKNGEVATIGIQCAEKLYFDIKMTATGQSRHSSIPSGDNPLIILSHAITRLTSRVAPPALNNVTEAYFKGLGENPEKFPLGTKEYSMLRNTIAPTVIAGGFRNNVIPRDAWVNLNVRLLPQTNIEDFVEELKRGANDTRVRFDYDQNPAMPKAPMSSMDSELFTSFREAAKTVYPNAKVLPYMSPGATDSADLRLLGVQAYGIAIPIIKDDEQGIHGDNERVSLEMFNKTLRFLWESVKGLAAEPR